MNCFHPIIDLELNTETGYVRCPACKGVWEERNFWLVASAQETIKSLSFGLEEANSEIRSLSRKLDDLDYEVRRMDKHVGWG